MTFHMTTTSIVTEALAVDVLAASNTALIGALKALTHRIHVAEHPAPRLTTIQSDRLDDLRTQRGAVEAEILRRMALGWEARA